MITERIICVTYNHGYIPFVVITFTPFLIYDLYVSLTEFVTRATRLVQLVEQELLTHPEHLSHPRFLVGLCCTIFRFLCSVL